MAEAERTKVRVLLGASRRREDFGPGGFRNLYRGQAHPAGSGMNQHPLARAEPGQGVQAVGGGQECDRQRRGLAPRERRGLAHDQRRRCDDVVGEAVGRHGH